MIVVLVVVIAAAVSAVIVVFIYYKKKNETDNSTPLGMLIFLVCFVKLTYTVVTCIIILKLIRLYTLLNQEVYISTL